MDRNNTSVTDTVIITSKTKDVCSQTVLDELIHRIQTYIVDVNEINDSNPLEIATLPGFKRIVVISPSHSISEQVRGLAADMPDCAFHFSATDIHMNRKSFALNHNSSLQVPEANRIFLVSPPASPPSDFDYDRLEENPCSSTTHDLYHSNENTSEPHVLLDNGQVLITLNPTRAQASSSLKSVATIKTSIPPSSTFDDI